jgi:hypothetical protein
MEALEARNRRIRRDAAAARAAAPRGPVIDGPGLQGAIWANMAIFERQLPQDEPHASERPDRSPGRPAVKRSRNDIQASATIDYKVDTQS